MSPARGPLVVLMWIALAIAAGEVHGSACAALLASCDGIWGQ